MPRDAITILHLSDMQFGKYHRFSHDHPGTPPNDYDNLTQRLILDLDYLMGKTTPKPKTPIAKPDLIICTGDLAEWGLPKEFTQAFEFLGKVAEHLELSRERVIVIPGNHDINRKQCESYFIECAADDEKPIFPWFPKWKQFKAAFDAFYPESSEAAFSPAEPWSLFPINELRVVVAGLNSTMDEGHDAAVNALADPGHHGMCGEKQLRWFSERLDSAEFAGWLRIGAIHHNLIRGCRNDNENLRDADEFQNILVPQLDLVLHGHTHHAKSEMLDGSVPVFSTGSASLMTRGADAIPTDVPNQYQVLTLKPGNVTRHCRRYNGADAPPKWIGDTSLSKDGSEWIVTSRMGFGSGQWTDPSDVDDEDNLEGIGGIRVPKFLRSSVNTAFFEAETTAADLFLDQVCRLTELRHERARIEKLHWQHRDMRCLSVSFTTESGIHSSRPLATCVQCPAKEQLEAFHASIVQQYRASEPRLMADCVFGDGAEIPAEVQSQADRLGIRLQRIGGYRGLLDLTDFIKGQTARVEEIQKRAAYRPDWYVNQRMNFEAGQIQWTTTDALTEVAGWMQQPGPVFGLILGEPGTGKTFLMLELARRLAAVPCMRPILVELRGMEKAKTVAAMLGALFADQKQPSDPKKLDHMIREGAVTLLFDGFDELALRVGYTRAADHLNEIIAAAQGEAPHIVVTSRTSHFESDKQVRNKLAEALQAGVQGLHYCHLLPFETPQIETFLQKRFPDESGEWMQLLRDVEDLIDLSRIPRMLAFITEVPRETLEQARKPGSGTVSAGDVYRLVVVGQWLPFEHKRMNQPGSAELFTVEQMLDAVRHLAHALWRNTDRFISLSELGDHSQRILEKFAPDKVGQEAHATHQLGSGTLLMRDADGRFTFIHQSIMEWLVAEQAARDLAEKGDTEILDVSEMSSLMADFFIDLAGQAETGMWATSLDFSDPSSAHGPCAKSNAALILKRLKDRYGMEIEHREVRDLAGADLSGRDFSREDLTGAKMQMAKLFEANLSDAILTGAVLKGADLRNAVIIGANLHSADVTWANLEDADLSYADLRGANLTGANLTRATLIGADLRGAEMAGSQWQMARLAGATLDDPVLDGLRAWGAGRPGAGHPPALLPVSSSANAVVWSPSGKVVATGHGNGCINLWDAHSGKCLRTLQGHTSTVMSVAFNADGSRMVSGSSDRTLRIWDAPNGECLQTLKGHTNPVWSVAFNADGSRIASGSSDHTLRIWDARSGNCLQTLKGHTNSIMSVAFNADGSRIASGSYDHTLRIWDAHNGKCLQTLQGHTNSIMSVVFNADGSQIASGSSDHTLRIWDVQNGNCLQTLKGHTNPVWSVAFNADGSRIASGSSDHTLRIWDARSGNCLQTLKGHTNSVMSVAFNAEGSRIASGSYDHTLRIWDAHNGKCLQTLQGHTNSVWSVAFNVKGSRIVSGSSDHTLRIWDAHNGKCLQTLKGHTNSLWSVAFNADGSRIASGSSDHTLRLWDAHSGNCLQTLKGHTNSIMSVAFNAEGSRVTSGSYDHTLRIWDAHSGNCLQTLQGHTNSVSSVAFNAQGSRIASGSSDRTLRIWDAPSGKCLQILQGHTNSVWSVAFNADGSRIASGSSDHTLRIWDARSGNCLQTLKGHTNSVMSVAFNAEGSRIASGSSDHTLRIWDAHSGKCLQTLQGHNGSIRSVVFWRRRSGGPSLLLSSSADGTIRLWDAEEGLPLAILLAYGDAWATLRPDGRYRAVGNLQDYLWHVSGLVRYELGELDEVDPHLQLAEDEPLILPHYFAKA